MSSLISQPSKPIRSRMMSRITIGDRLAGRSAIPGGVDDVRRHPHRRPGEALERLEIAFQLFGAGGDHRQLLVAVDQRAAVARHMLDHADHAGRRHAVEHCAAERGDLHRLRAQRAVADDVASRPPAGRRATAGNSTLIPHERSISASARAFERTASIADDGAASVKPGERARRRERRAIPAAAFARPGRPPGRSGSANRRGRSRSRSESVSRSSCSGVSQLRRNRMIAGRLGVAEEAALSSLSSSPASAVDRRLHQAVIGRRSNFRRPPSAPGTPPSRRPAMPPRRAAGCRPRRARSSCPSPRPTGSAPTARSMPARPAPGWRRRRAGPRCPRAPLGFGLGCRLRGRGLVSRDGGAASALSPASRQAPSGSLPRSSCESRSSPALVSNAVSLSPATSSPPGLGGLIL